MTRISLIAGLASAVALSLGAVSAQAATFHAVPGIHHSGKASVVENVRYRRYAPHHRYHRWHHRSWR